MKDITNGDRAVMKKKKSVYNLAKDVTREQNVKLNEHLRDGIRSGIYKLVSPPNGGYLRVELQHLNSIYIEYKPSLKLKIITATGEKGIEIGKQFLGNTLGHNDRNQHIWKCEDTD